jgi:hypothetical protein
MYCIQHFRFGDWVSCLWLPIGQELHGCPAVTSMAASQHHQESSTAAHQGHQMSSDDSSLPQNAGCHILLHFIITSLVSKVDVMKVSVKKMKCHLLLGVDLDANFCLIKCPFNWLGSVTPLSPMLGLRGKWVER